MKIDREKVLLAARNGIPLTVQTFTLPPETEIELEEILHLFLTELGQTDLHDGLAYCLKELTGNAKKANTKRVYFEEQKLDLTNLDDYARGMTSFKEKTLQESSRYLKLQEAAGLYIKTTFLIHNNSLYLSVRNNALMTKTELTRAYDRIARSHAFQSMAEAMDEVLDSSEGAGLGIVMLLMMLKKMGLNEKAFELKVSEIETNASLWIPMEGHRQEGVSGLSQELVEVIESIPPFPENLEVLRELLEQEDVALGAVANRLARDPAMASDLIKYLNAASLGNRNRVTSISDAVQLVGLNGIRGLLLSYGAHKVLASYLDQQRQVWDDAVRVSQLAVALSRYLKVSKAEVDLTMVGGLLHNLGQIITGVLHPERNNRIQEFCRLRDVGLALFEELAPLVNPAELGAQVAEKWNFPTDLVDLLRHRPWPAKSPAAARRAVAIVRLAELLTLLKQGLVNLDQVSLSVTSLLGINRDVLPTLADQLLSEE